MAQVQRIRGEVAGGDHAGAAGDRELGPAELGHPWCPVPAQADKVVAAGSRLGFVGVQIGPREGGEELVHVGLEAGVHGTAGGGEDVVVIARDHGSIVVVQVF
ncbi:hypothetical protein GCM10028801_37510 [Nocardioides maradonensis]